jgi:hypothetical protein
VRAKIKADKAERANGNGNGHTSNGHALTRREEEIIAKVAQQFVPGTLCTEEDLEVGL